MATINWNATLSEDVVQTILPVLARHQGSAVATGYFIISSTTFDGSETEFEVDTDVEVPIRPVVLPKRGYDGSLNNAIVPEYMAVVYDWEFHRETNPYAGIPTFIPAHDNTYFMQYIQASGDYKMRGSWGNLIGSLRIAMDQVSSGPAPSGPPVVGEDDVTQYWRASIPFGGLGVSCAFYDLNWVDTFESTSQGALGSPNRIEIVSNPSGNILKAMVVRQNPTYVGEGGVLYDTLRIVALVPNVPAGDYEFEFKIVGANDQSVSVDFKLTVS